MMRNYTGKRARTCLGRNPELQNVFIGDSTTREVFWAVARQLDRRAAVEAFEIAERHQDLTFAEGKTEIYFYWDPYLNSTNTARMMKGASEDGDTAAPQVDLLVVGAGLWFSHIRRDPVHAFKDAIDSVTERLAEADPASVISRRTLLMPVQPPYYEKLDEGHQMIKQDNIDAMNEYLEEVAGLHGINLLSAFLRMADDLPSSAWEQRGIHLMSQVTDWQAELILNLHCNEEERGYPVEGTCCLNYSYHYLQLVLAFVGVALLLFVAWQELQIWAKPGTNFGSDGTNRTSTLWPFLIMAGTLFYCYLADRTHLFNKMSKLYNTQDWGIFLVGIAVVGLASIRKSVTPGRLNQEKPSNQDQPFLSRDQTDEWKGWMQLLILAYHYTGASKVLWIYKIVRLLVASYLFMTGYGHAAYFYQKQDFSIKRVVAVLIRLNLLSVLLPWSMHSDYLFYYFAPLVTYWYAIIYLTMRIKSHWNQDMPTFLFKLGISSCLTTFLHTQPWLLEPLFKSTNYVFGSHWDAKEWLFRCALDQYIVYIGMLVSVVYIRAKKPPAPPAPPQNSMATTSHTQPGHSPKLASSLYYGASVGAIVSYAYLSNGRVTKSSSNALHPYISPLPILAFIHLRNSSSTLRNSYSEAFAWIGRISLETFILQYHIWMAADTKGLLDLGLLGVAGMTDGSGALGRGMGLVRWVNCIVLGTVFIWVSSKAAAATGSITSSLMSLMFR